MRFCDQLPGCLGDIRAEVLHYGRVFSPRQAAGVGIRLSDFFDLVIGKLDECLHDLEYIRETGLQRRFEVMVLAFKATGPHLTEVHVGVQRVGSEMCPVWVPHIRQVLSEVMISGMFAGQQPIPESLVSSFKLLFSRGFHYIIPDVLHVRVPDPKLPHPCLDVLVDVPTTKDMAGGGKLVSQNNLQGLLTVSRQRFKVSLLL